MRCLVCRAATALLALVPAAPLPAAPGPRTGEAAARAPLVAEHALEYVLGVVVVMIALGVFAFVLRRVHGAGGAARGSLRVAASLPLGGKERLVVVEADGERLLLGVGGGGVQLLRRLRAAPPGAAATPDSWLARTLRESAAR